MVIVPVWNGKASIAEALLFAVGVTTAIGIVVVISQFYLSWRLRKWCNSQKYSLIAWRTLSMGELPDDWKSVWSVVHEDVIGYEAIVQGAGENDKAQRVLIAWHPKFPYSPQVVYKSGPS